jgi:tRNA(fMet)-specific endonuclease VapC
VIEAVVDTSAMIDLWKGGGTVLRRVRPAVVPLVVVAELEIGPLLADDPADERSKIAETLALLEARIVTPTATTAELWARLAASRMAGRKRRKLDMSHHDLWVAATALELGLPIATVDEDFTRLPGITLVDAG